MSLRGGTSTTRNPAPESASLVRFIAPWLDLISELP